MVVFGIMSVHDSNCPFKQDLQLGEEPTFTRNCVGGVGNLINHRSALFG